MYFLVSIVIDTEHEIFQHPTEHYCHVYSNLTRSKVVDCMNALVGACKDFGYPIPEDYNGTLDLISNAGTDRLTYEDHKAITKLFKDESVQKAYGNPLFAHVLLKVHCF